MEKCYALKIDEKKKLQDDSDLSFIGGFPKLSPDMKIPKCTLYDKEEKFMFQIYLCFFFCKF